MSVARPFLSSALFRLIAPLLTALLFAPALHAQQADAYVVMDDNSGHIFSASNENRKLPVGSLANIATAMVVLDWLDVTKGNGNVEVPIPPAALANPRNPIGFQQGDSVTLRDLLYAALMQSDDIAATALADYVGEALPAGETHPTPMQRFVAQMNALARKLALKNTLFMNPTGEDEIEHRPPYSTAADMAHLAIYAMNRSQFRFYVSQKERQIAVQHNTGGATQYMLENTNDLLNVDAIDGVRTGTTRKAGPCVIISSARPPDSRQEGGKYIITPRRLVVVVLGAPNRFEIASQLLRGGWDAYERWFNGGRPAGHS